MRTEARALAPAKVNLHLLVGPRRSDGFHDLVSLFQAVDLYDEVRVRLLGEPVTRVIGAFDFPSSDNIVSKAVEVFRGETGIAQGVEIRVDKRIPVGAGFGGGSSDAAATLRCLQALLRPDLSADSLAVMAGKLGSDVPFFLGPAAALVEGRGERITPLAPRTDYAVVAVVPDEAIGTAAAYAALDAGRPREAVPAAAAATLAAEYAARQASQWRFANSFDPVGLALPRVAAALDAMLAAGAASVRLTGSGSALISPFDGAGEARECVRRVNAAGFRGVLLLPLATIPHVW